MNRLIYLCLFVTSFCFWGCLEEERFDTAAGDKLVFSTDTLSFDTVLAGVATPTQYFMIYNPNKDGISITDISFGPEGSQGFRVNVDGVFITGGNLNPTIDCRSKDSLRVFVELTAMEFDGDMPKEFISHLIFTLANGKQGSVVLTAKSQSVTTLKAVHIKNDTTFSSRKPYLIYDSLTIDPGATLKLAAGTRLYFHPDAKMEVYGTIVCNGTLENQILMRGDRIDLMFENQPYDRIPNQWQGIHFHSSSFNNYLNYCDIHSGNNGIVCDSSSIDQEKLRMENCIVHNMNGDCIRLFASKAFLGNTQISNAGGNCLCLCGGDVMLVHCTIASFFPFAIIGGSAVACTNEYHGYGYPLKNLLFQNCLITGYSEDEISFYQSTELKDVSFNYSFENCLLCTKPKDKDEHYLFCQWDTKNNHEVWREGNFPEFNLDALTYNFKLVEKSAARNIGNTDVSISLYPTDRLGILRLLDGQTDAGCYEYVENNKN